MNMNRIMLRFRPIAPKPPGCDAAEEERRINGVKRTKRKYVRVRRRQSKRKTTSSPLPEKSVMEEDSALPESEVVTLQLLPERSDDTSCETDVRKLEENSKWSVDQSTIPTDLTADIGGGSLNARSEIETWIIVESVTDSHVDISAGSLGLGFSDKEKIFNLQVDTCPGFVSDNSNKVVWVNEACKKMVGGVSVCRLVVKEKLPYFYPSFACSVRVIQHTRYGQKWNNKIVPCDVWKMEFQGFAWKLDVKTAIGLSI